MKIIVPSTGSKPDRATVNYVIRIAKRLGAQLLALRITGEKETQAEAQRCLQLFHEIGKKEKVTVHTFVISGDAVTAVIDLGRKESADVIILGASHGEVVAEWLNAGAADHTDIPVLMIPKWVPVPEKSSSND
jgi:nucleotide-binding universal stress UspA family protein